MLISKDTLARVKANCVGSFVLESYVSYCGQMNVCFLNQNSMGVVFASEYECVPLRAFFLDAMNKL